MDCGDTAPSSLSVVFPGQLLLSQGKFLGYRCDLRRLFTGSLCSLEFSTLYLQFSSRRHCWQHLVRSVFLVLLWKISWTLKLRWKFPCSPSPSPSLPCWLWWVGTSRGRNGSTQTWMNIYRPGDRISLVSEFSTILRFVKTGAGHRKIE